MSTAIVPLLCLLLAVATLAVVRHRALAPIAFVSTVAYGVVRWTGVHPLAVGASALASASSITTSVTTYFNPPPLRLVCGDDKPQVQIPRAAHHDFWVSVPPGGCFTQWVLFPRPYMTDFHILSQGTLTEQFLFEDGFISRSYLDTPGVSFTVEQHLAYPWRAVRFQNNSSVPIVSNVRTNG